MHGISLTISPEILNNEKDLLKSDLWSIAIIIYFMYFKEYPYIGKNELMLFKDINSGKKLKSIENKELNDLMNKLLKINIKERLSWNEYFNHSFFENGKDEIIKEKLNFITKDKRKNELYEILFSSVPKEYLKKKHNFLYI
jgi:serine/threonine protein kinase